MAAIPINKFRRILAPLSAFNASSVLYTAPSQRVTLLLNVQATNTGITNSTETVTFGISSQSTGMFFKLVDSFEIPVNDAASLLTGKTILEPGDSIFSYCTTFSAVSISISLLETYNEA